MQAHTMTADTHNASAMRSSGAVVANTIVDGVRGATGGALAGVSMKLGNMLLNAVLHNKSHSAFTFSNAAMSACILPAIALTALVGLGSIGNAIEHFSEGNYCKAAITLLGSPLGGALGGLGGAALGGLSGTMVKVGQLVLGKASDHFSGARIGWTAATAAGATMGAIMGGAHGLLNGARDAGVEDGVGFDLEMQQTRNQR